MTEDEAPVPAMPNNTLIPITSPQLFSFIVKTIPFLVNGRDSSAFIFAPVRKNA
jgi:hypothetical protein